MVLLQFLPTVGGFPTFQYKLNEYMEFEFKPVTFIWLGYILYYYIMEPVAAVCTFLSRKNSPAVFTVNVNTSFYTLLNSWFLS